MTQSEIVAQEVEYYPSADAWVEEGGKVHLLGSRCAMCGKVAFPRRTICDQCGSTGEFESVRLSNTGTLYSFSEVHVAPKGFATPYVVAYVDLPEGVRLFGQVEHSASELQLDEPVEIVVGVIRTREDGCPVVSYKFRKRGEVRDA